MSTNGTAGQAHRRTPEEIQADVELQRERLAETVDQLGDRLDVKGRARARATGWKDSATTASGRPRPQLVAAAGVLAAAVVGLWVWRRQH